MKKILYTIVAAACALFSSYVPAGAQQNFRTGYFLDGYAYRYRLNPAFQGERGYFAFPVAGRTEIGVQSSLALSDLFYPTGNGQLATFLHPDVPASDVLARINDNNRLGLNIDMGILSAGFRTGKCYHTIDISTKTGLNMNLPGTLFEFAKNGAAGGRSQYDIGNLGARLDSRMEIAYGFSRSVTDNIYVGARLKFLVGLARMSVIMDRMSLEMSEQQWAVSASGSMTTSGMLAFKTKGEAEISDSPAYDNMMSFEPDESMLQGINLSSFGAAADLGVTWKFLRYFTFSASVLDLGFMSWGNTMKAATPDISWKFDGFGNDIFGEDSPSFGEQLESMSEDLLNAFNFERRQSGIKSAEMISMTAHIGLEARMPFYEKMSLGLLGTRRFDGRYSWTEGRLALNLAPVKWFGLTGNYAFSDFGHSVGAALSFHMKGFNFCLGTDSFLPLMNVTPQFVPISNWNTNVTFSLTTAFGKYNKTN